MNKKTLRKVLHEVNAYKGFIVISMICAIATVVLTLLIPVLTGKAIDCIIGPNEVDFIGLVKVLKTIAAVIVATFATQLCMNRANNHITYSVTRELRKKAFARLEKMPLKQIDSHSHGDYMSRIVSDADTLADGLLMGFTQLFTGVVTIVGTIVFMIRLNYLIAIVVIILTPASLLLAKFISSRTYTMFKAQAEIKGKQTEFVDEMISGKRIVETFGYQKNAIEDFAKINDDLQVASQKAVFYSSLTNPCTRFINSMIYAGVCLSGAILAIKGGITVGGLSSFLGYASQYSKPFNEISAVITELQNALACADRLFELLESEIETDEESKDYSDKLCWKGNIEFFDVDFSYTDDKPLIEKLNLLVDSGQKVAIVGPTGAGKTTLINLLMRFYDVNNGTIKVDGVDIRDIERSVLRENFGMVLQDTWLMEGTIKENLLMANPNATDEEMIAAAKAAHAHEFIKRLPNKYDTYLKAAGGSLSQGQKQLLCIARVMLNLPPMLILDEATSSIDTRTEMKIQKAFNEMMKGRTTFVVAHRLSTIKNADVILYMENGHVLEQGNHDELINKKGYYYTLYNSQFVL